MNWTSKLDVLNTARARGQEAYRRVNPLSGDPDAGAG